MTRWILALDGGGIRGAASARFLERLEAELKRPLAQVFDLYAGTSTGAKQRWQVRDSVASAFRCSQISGCT